MPDDALVPAVSGDASSPVDLSLADHEQQFGEGAPSVAAAEAGAAGTAATTEPLPDDAETRERDATGKFVTKRAKSQQATREDVPRITALSTKNADLSRRLQEAVAERDALKAARSVEATPGAVIEPPLPAGPAAKPNVNDFQDYTEYVEALADWKIAKARDEDRAQQAREADTARLAASWKERVDAAKADHADFDEVALLAPTSIPQGSLIDAWILEHRAGAKVLYHLQKHPEELTDLLHMPVFDQTDALSLLSQRLLPSSRPQATPTGAVAGSPVVLSAPRPPTPVRTGPVRTIDEPPGDDASIAAHEKVWGERRRRV